MWQKRVRKNDDDERVVKDAEKSRVRTMNRAVKLLAAKPRSVAELRKRLLEKLWTNEKIVDDVIEKLKEYKYLDDEQFARDLASSKLRQKPQGRRRLERSLAQKQLDRELIGEAIDAAFEEHPESELLDIAIEKHIRIKGMPKTREDMKRLIGHLSRLGFDYGAIREKTLDLKSQK